MLLIIWFDYVTVLFSHLDHFWTKLTLNMKRDLYRFAKARRDKRMELFKLSADEIKMVEHNYYSKFNTNYFG